MTQTVGLYLTTDKQEPPTLQNLAKLVATFDSLASEIAFIVDPSSKLVLRVHSIENESISVRSIIEFAKEKTPSKEVCGIIILTLAGWLATDIRAYITAETIKKYIVNEQIDIPDSEIEKIANRVADKINKGAARLEYKEFLESVVKEDGISGVGIITKEDKTPTVIYPKNHFDSQLAALQENTVEDYTTRTYEYRERLIVLSPVLLQDGDKRWKFSGPDHEFGAPVKDSVFLKRVLSGALRVPMTTGVVIDATFKMKEKKQDGFWKPVYHEILEVHGVEAPMTQQSFPITGGDDK